MSAIKPTDTLVNAIEADPLAGIRDFGSALADLAFGSLSRADSVGGRHLAFLPAEALELDLSDPAQRQFGDYELIELIGEGGMGVVYRARQESLDREVAVKLLAAGPWASREFVERFRREAQNAARMQHPNIVAIYEVGSAEELHFFSMRLIRGPSLSAVIKRDGKLPAQRAAILVRIIAEALDYAHRLGVLHLDLKPANVLLDENGNPHVADFGLARRIDNTLAADNDEISGTPSYMAPEQAQVRTQKITPATDIWGLGAILYELVTGQPPFLGDSPQATLKLVVEGAVISPRRLIPDLPRDLEAIILKCMTHAIESRYPTARALADDLGRFVENRPVLARHLNSAQRVWRWARRQPYIAALGLLFTISLLVGIATTTAQWQRAEEQRSHAEEQQQLAESNAAISHQQAWKSRRESALRLQVDGKGFEALPLLMANIEEQEKAGISAANERQETGMIRAQGVTLIDRMIIPDAHPITSALSPDGSILAIGLDDLTVRWYDTATLTLRGQVDVSDLPTSDGATRVPQLLRFVDDHKLRITLEAFSYLTNPSNIDTYLVDLNRGVVIAPPALFEDFADANYSADGNFALLTNTRHEMQFWQVDPWRPLSERTFFEHAESRPWLLARGAKIGLTMNASNKGPRKFDPRNLTKMYDLALPNHGPISSWQENGAGTQVAIGDSQGRIFVVDLATWSVRQFPTQVGTAVNWLAFSEDDAWLAAARADGSAFAFDVASGNALHSGEMRNDFELRYTAISHRDRILVASGAGDVALWHLPDAGVDGVEAAHLISSPTRSEFGALYWTGVSMRNGLLVTADMDGEVRLWRLPKDVAPPASSPPHIPDRLYFDGEHVMDVVYNKLRVANVRTAKATEWIELPHRIAFAVLVDNAKTLLATSSNDLYVLDANTLKQRYAPIKLDAHPQRFAASADGSIFAISTLRNAKNGLEERLSVYDIKTGKLRVGDVAVKGPLRQMELSLDASRLVTTGSGDGATEVFDTATLHRVGAYKHDPSQPVLWASFTSDATHLWLVTRNIDNTRGSDAEVVRWNPSTDAIEEKRNIAGVWPIGITVIGDVPVLAGQDRVMLNPGATGERSSARLYGGEPTTVFAVSHDRRLIANAYGRFVQIYDATTLEPIGPSLATNTRSLDVIANLAFSSDDSYLLGNTQTSQRWLVWPIAADKRNVEELRRDSNLLAPAPRGKRILQIATTEQRARLRASDPGWHSDEVRPTVAAARFIDGMPVPARDPNLSPLLLDLTNFYNIAPDSARPVVDTVLPVASGLPLGSVTLDGVDYDVRGALEMRWDTGAALSTLHSVVASIPLPPINIAALHVLLYAPQPVPVSSEVSYASIHLHYRDGTQAVLTMRTQHEVPGWTNHDRPVPIGWVSGDYLVRGGGQGQPLFSNPRLLNPHPERIIASIDLEASTEHWAEPVFFAITVEPVIPVGKSRNNSAESATTKNFSKDASSKN